MPISEFFVVRGLRYFKNAAARHVAALHPQVMAQCLRHTLPQRSGSSQQRSKIEELGRGVYRLNMCAEITSTRRHLHVYRYVCRCVCVCVCVCTYVYAYVCLTS